MAVAPLLKPPMEKEVGKNKEPSPSQTANMLPLTFDTQKEDAPTTPRKSSLQASHPRQIMEPMLSPTPASMNDETTNQNDESGCRHVKRKRDGSFSDAGEESQSPRPVKAGRYFGAMMIDAFDTEFNHIHRKAKTLEDKLVSQQEEQKAVCASIEEGQLALRSAFVQQIALHEGEKTEYNKLQKEHIKKIKVLKERIKAVEETTSGHKEHLASLEEDLKSKASREALEDYVMVLSTKIEELEGITKEQVRQRSTDEGIQKIVKDECAAVRTKIETSSAGRIKATSEELRKRIEAVNNKTNDDVIIARKKEFALDARMDGYDASLQTVRDNASALKSSVNLHQSQLMELKMDNFSDGERMERFERNQKNSTEVVEKLRTDIMAVQRNLETVREDFSPIPSQMVDHTARLDALDSSRALAKLEKFFDNRIIEVKEDLTRDFEKRIKRMQKQHDAEKVTLQQQHDSEKASQHAAIQAMQEAMRRDKAALEELVRAELKAQRENFDSAKATSKKAEKVESAAWKRLERRVNDSCFEYENLKMGFQDDHTRIQHLQRIVDTNLKGNTDVSALRANVKKLITGQEKLVKDVDAQVQRMNVVERDVTTSIAKTKEEFSISIANTGASFSTSILNVGTTLSTTVTNTKADLLQAISSTVRCSEQRCSDRAKEVKEGLGEVSSTVNQINVAYQALQMGLGGFLGTPLRPAAYPSPPPQSQPNSPALQVSTTHKKGPHTPCGPGPSPHQQFQHSPGQTMSPASPPSAQASPLSNVPVMAKPPAAQTMTARPQTADHNHHQRTHSVPLVQPQHILPSNAHNMQPPSPYMPAHMLPPRPAGPNHHQQQPQPQPQPYHQ